VILKLQLRQFGGNGNNTSTEVPAGIGGVGSEKDPAAPKSTVVTEAPASVAPWFFTVTNSLLL